MSRMSSLFARARVPAAIYVVSALVYVLMLGDRARTPSPDNHFVHLAWSFLHGELGVVGNTPPGTNDWALFDGRWYVSFPPFPAIVILPAVALFGLATLDRLFWALFAGLAPALVFVLLRALRERGHSDRTQRDDLLLTGLFAFGSVYFFTAVQGSVWFAAHVVGSSLLALYALFSLDARRPALAGAMLGLAFMTRATTAFAVPFFLVELLRVSRGPDAPAFAADAHPLVRVRDWLRGVRWGAVVKPLALFAAPILLIGIVAMWMNEARFDNPFEFGHTYLQIRWRERIERWGLFNFHYLPKNLAVFLAVFPWISSTAPYVTISRHGIALWLTTPNLLWTLWPKRVSATQVALYVTVAVVATLNLMYQNSGWIQFGYRFSLDYMVFLVALIALGGRRFGPGFVLCAVVAVIVNTFGAITFDRAWQHYDGDSTQNVLFQPD